MKIEIGKDFPQYFKPSYGDDSNGVYLKIYKQQQFKG
jgi:hypothetical protein